MGNFVLYDLLTSDPAAALDFYSGLLGWEAKAPDSNGYHELYKDGLGFGGLMPLSAGEAGMPPAWLGYVDVPDIDIAVANLQAAGGRVHRALQRLPGVGRFAVVADPQGAVFQLFQADAPMDPPPPLMARGFVGWRELVTADPEAAHAFYAAQFDWAAGEPLDLGPMGLYHIFGSDGVDRGGIMRRPSEAMPPAWLFYFSHPNIDEGAAAVAAGGGRVLNGPMPIPGGMSVIQAADPQGAIFALVGPRPNQKEQMQ